MSEMLLLGAGPYDICLACDAAAGPWEPIEHDEDCPALEED